MLDAVTLVVVAIDPAPDAIVEAAESASVMNKLGAEVDRCERHKPHISRIRMASAYASYALSSTWYRDRYHQVMAWTVRLSDGDEAALAAQADVEGRSKSEVTRDALREYLMRRRRWATPMFGDDDAFDLGGPIGKDDIREAMRQRPTR